MYSLDLVGLGALGELLTSDKILSLNKKYTFQFDSGKLIDLKSDSWVLDQLRFFMQNYGEVVSVDGFITAKSYAIVVYPKIETTLANWLSAFEYSWKGMGYSGVVFIKATEGESSSGSTFASLLSIPEKIASAVGKATGSLVGESVGGSLSGALKPVIPVVFGVLALVVGYLIFAKPSVGWGPGGVSIAHGGLEKK